MILCYGQSGEIMTAGVFRKIVGQLSNYTIAGEPVCPYCGSTNIIVRGFAGSNRRHDCIDCGSTVRIDW
jgi:hypothetical protein